VGKIKQAFSDSNIYFNFLFMNKDPQNTSGIYMREQSEDVFSTFVEVAKATGGIVDNSQNPSFSFKNGCKAAKYSYLLYYNPKNYSSDGKYKKIEVKLKNKDYKVSHRQGYFAN
jgi:hypothetical protein